MTIFCKICNKSVSVFPCEIKKGRKYCSLECKNIGQKKAVSGNKNGSWIGKNITYNGIHSWVRNKFGRATHCDRCFSNELEKTYHWANISGCYLRGRSDWQQLCVSCHLKYDGTTLKSRIIPSKHNKSGFVGVDYRKDKKIWRASISIEGKVKHLGYFPFIENAIVARENALNKYLLGGEI